MVEIHPYTQRPYLIISNIRGTIFWVEAGVLQKRMRAPRDNIRSERAKAVTL